MQPKLELEGEIDARWNAESVVCAEIEHGTQKLLNTLIIRLIHISTKVELTCLPRARRTPPATADVASKTWNKDTSGRIEATRAATCGSLLNRYAQEDRNMRKRELIELNVCCDNVVLPMNLPGDAGDREG
jgi:hypothetical protein